MSLTLRLGPCRVDLASRRAERAGAEITLTAREWDVLAYLAARQGQDVSIEALHREVWGCSPRVHTRAAFHAMRRLRAKLEVQPEAPRYLRTAHGVGYRLDPDPEPVAPPCGALVGREALLARVRPELRPGALVTLKGPGGVGKTRLARELAAEQACLFVELADARTEEDVAAAFAGATGHTVPEGPGPVLERVGRALAVGPAERVFLDDFEALIELSPWIARWRTLAPARTWLVTSREVLGLTDEIVFEVAPLGEADAVEVLRQTARRRGHPVAPDDDADLVRLARAVGGLPLALELAAGWFRVARPEDVLRWVEADRLDALRSFDRDAPQRRASATAVVEGSWRALPPGLRRALAACAVFTGPFSPAEAAAVPEVGWDGLRGLLDRSLVSRRPDGSCEVLPTVRTFAAAAEPAAVDRARWARAEACAELPMEGPALTRSYHELVAAARWALDRDVQLAARIACRLARSCIHLGLSEPIRTILARLRTERLPPTLRFRLQVAECRVYLAMGDRIGARRSALELEAGSEEQVLEMLELRVEVKLETRDLDVEDDLARLPADSEARSTFGALLALRRGRPREALAALESRPPDPSASLQERAYWNYVRGEAWVTVGDVEAAEQALRESRELYQAAGSDPLARLQGARIAEICASTGRLEEAARLYREALPQWEPSTALRASLANVEAELGHVDRAEVGARATLELARRTGEVRGGLLAQVALAHALQRQGRLAEAVEALGDPIGAQDHWVRIHALTRRAAIARAAGADPRPWVERGLKACDEVQMGRSPVRQALLDLLEVR